MRGASQLAKLRPLESIKVERVGFMLGVTRPVYAGRSQLRSFDSVGFHTYNDDHHIMIMLTHSDHPLSFSLLTDALLIITVKNVEDKRTVAADRQSSTTIN